eukprot:4834059-Pyramimonas_sp.AAC.1
MQQTWTQGARSCWETTDFGGGAVAATTAQQLCRGTCDLSSKTLFGFCSIVRGMGALRRPRW